MNDARTTMPSINVHLHEDIRNEDLELLIQLSERIPIAISIAPLHLREKRFSPEVLEKLSSLISKKGNILGQRGDKNYCMLWAHQKTDRYHENRCSYSRSHIPYDQQRAFMAQGKKTLEEAFKRAPTMYIPPNHLYDDTTIEAALALDYQFFSMFDVLGLQPFRLSDLIMLPERSCERTWKNAHAVYTHLDHLAKHWSTIKEIPAPSIREFIVQLPVPSLYRPAISSNVNEALKWIHKYRRDVKNILGTP